MLDAVTLATILGDDTKKKGIAKQAEEIFTAHEKVKDAFDGKLRGLLDIEQSSSEYQKLFKDASSPWLTSIINAHCHLLRPDGWSGDQRLWDIYQANGMKAKQQFLIQETLTYGHSFVAVLPSDDDNLPVLTVMSAKNTYAKYSPWSSYPDFVVQKIDKNHWIYIDSEAFYYLEVTPSVTIEGSYGGNGIKSVDNVTKAEHNLGFCPVVRIDEQAVDDKINLPVAPFSGAITKAQALTEVNFHIGMVERKASFPRLWGTGVDFSGLSVNNQQAGDILNVQSPDARFGSFDQADMNGLVSIKDGLKADLAELTHTPAHMLASGGTMANLSAEALGALNFTYLQQAGLRKTSIGEGLDELFRTIGYIVDIEVTPSHTIHWDYVEPNNLGQVGDYSVKMNQLGAPLEGVFQMHPNVDQAKAKEMADYVETHQAATNVGALVDLDIKRAQLAKIFVDMGYTREEALEMARFRIPE